MPEPMALGGGIHPDLAHSADALVGMGGAIKADLANPTIRC